MAYINPKLDYKEGDILYGSDLNASNLVIKKGVDDNYDKIKDIEVFNTELDTDITNLEVALEENVTTLEKSIADNVTILEKSIDDNLKKIEAVERFTTNLESDINTLASGATPIATKHTRGFVQVGDNLNVDSNGVISGKDPYVLPIATDNVIGGVSIGANIDTDGKGKISVKGVKGSNNISVVEQDGNYHIAYTGENFKKEIVGELPPVGKDDVIYLLKKDTASGSDIYDEYLWIDGVWNPIGSTDVDLSNYYDKSTVDEKLDAKADKGDVGGKEVFVSSTQPSDTSMQIWIDESEDGSTFDPTSFYKKEETDELLEELDTKLTEYVDTARGEVNYINVIHSNKDKFIEDLEVGKLYYLTGEWYYKKDVYHDTTDVNFSGGYIGYVTEPYTNNFRFEGICFESAWGIETIEILNIYGESPSSMYGRVREPADNLTTDYGDIALSARQGMVLKGLIDTLQNQVDNINPEIPIASSEVLGGIKVGENLEIDENGILSAISNNIDTLPIIGEHSPTLKTHLNDIIPLATDEGKSEGNVFTGILKGLYTYGSAKKNGGDMTHSYLLYMYRYNSYQDYACLYDLTTGDVKRITLNSTGNMSDYGSVKPVNSLTSTATYIALSAAQGKALNDRLKIVESNYNKRINWHYGTSSSAESLYYLGSGVHYVGNYIKQNDKTSIQKIDRPMLLLMDGSTMAVGLSIDMATGDLYTHTLPSAGNSSSSSTTINTKKIGGDIDLTGYTKNVTLGENFTNSSSITLSESFENYSEIDVYLHNEDKTIEEKVTIVNPRQSYLAYEKVISHVDLGVFYMLEYLINYDSTTTLSVTGNTGKSIDDTVTTVTSADMPTLYIGKVVGR